MEKWHRVLSVPDLKSLPSIDSAYRLVASSKKVDLVQKAMCLSTFCITYVCQFSLGHIWVSERY